MTAALTLEQQKANRKLWIEALRSGKYQQGVSFLRDEQNHYCCLGVLADVAGCEWRERDGQPAQVIFEGMPFDTVAPPTAMAFVGLRSSLGRINADHVLADINDKGTPFSEIADIIESEPPGLFTP